MKRGILLVLALLAAFAPPVSAAAPPTVVYEIVRAPGSPASSTVTIRYSGNEPTIAMYVDLEPAGARGYRYRGAGVEMLSSGGGWSQTTVDLPAGHRYLLGGERGRFRVEVTERGWSVRQAGSGFRVVTAAAGDRREVAGVAYDEYRGATAQAGPHGSVAFATVPCRPGIGTWRLRAEGDPAGPERTCGLGGGYSGFGDTTRGRRWTVEAAVTGVRAWDYRLAVLDYPKR